MPKRNKRAAMANAAISLGIVLVLYLTGCSVHLEDGAALVLSTAPPTASATVLPSPPAADFTEIEAMLLEQALVHAREVSPDFFDYDYACEASPYSEEHKITDITLYQKLNDRVYSGRAITLTMHADKGVLDYYDYLSQAEVEENARLLEETDLDALLSREEILALAIAAAIPPGETSVEAPPELDDDQIMMRLTFFRGVLMWQIDIDSVPAEDEKLISYLMRIDPETGELLDIEYAVTFRDLAP